MDVTLALTHDCNLGCGYCYAGGKFNRHMSPEVAAAAVDLAFEGPEEAVQLSFFGGEPLLRWEQLVESAERARVRAKETGKRLVMSVTTNGTLLTAPRADRLEELGVYVGLSIDGTRLAHDAGRPKMGGGSSFDDVYSGLSVLLRRGTSFETISVVTPANVRHLGDSIRWLLEVGVPRVGLNPCYEAHFTDDDLALYGEGLRVGADAMVDCYRSGRVVSVTVFDNKILAALKGGLAAGDKCSRGTTSVAVAPSGNLYSCEREVGEDDDPTFRIGHVRTGLAPRAEACDPAPVNPECTDCTERNRCSSFCVCANYAETGRTDVAGGTQCWHERETARLADEIAGTLWSERNALFIAWFYGRVAGAKVPSPEPSRPYESPPSVIRRPSKASDRVRLTVVR
ncbi:MAG: radical SAM protein [Deltaproteobacteria bacterium]|nr:radical SAM protein [Deltaproteobacteria bacterium]